MRFEIPKYQDPRKHKLLHSLGPEPLSAKFNTEYLYAIAQQHRQAIKQFIMNNHIVVGIGNIYACEALFLSGINPKTAANNISKVTYKTLIKNIRSVLRKAIKYNGTTIRNFAHSNGKPGNFGYKLNVYGRSGKKCKKCANTIEQIKQGQRSTFYCPHCQK